MFDAEDEFDAYDKRAKAAAASAIWVDDKGWTEADLPSRPWVARGYALRGAVTVVAGPPSTLKSSLMLAWAAAIALGRPHGDFQPTEMGTVVVYNVEDDQTEQRRRLSAVLRQFDAVPADIAGKIVRVGPSGVRDPNTGDIVSTAAMDRLREVIRERAPALLIADPLAELHTADENDNTALRSVIAEFRAIATEFNIAVILVHHTRKGSVTPGDPDSARGASSIIGAGRIVATLVGMSEDDADALGLPKERKFRSQYVRLDGAKSNYAALGDPGWYEKTVYTLDNGEIVPAAVPWTAPDMWRDVPIPVANRILDEIDAGLDGGKQRYSGQARATTRAAWHVVLRHVASFTEQQARQIIKAWIKNGVLMEEIYTDKAEGEPRAGLRVINAKRPGARAT
jgi:AAA domain